MSVSEQGQEITARFFLAIDTLKNMGKVRSLRQITTMYNVNYGNMHSIKTNSHIFILKPELIANLCRDFSISAEWILLGTGEMFKNE